MLDCLTLYTAPHQCNTTFFMPGRSLFYIIMITIAALLNSCAKTSLTAGLPPVTTTGAMTFGCVFNGGTPFAVNGKYVAGNSWGPFNSCTGGVSTFFNGDSLTISATNCPLNTFYADFVFYAPGITTGTYDIGP